MTICINWEICAGRKPSVLTFLPLITSCQHTHYLFLKHPTDTFHYMIFLLKKEQASAEILELKSTLSEFAFATLEYLHCTLPHSKEVNSEFYLRNSEVSVYARTLTVDIPNKLLI